MVISYKQNGDVIAPCKSGDVFIHNALVKLLSELGRYHTLDENETRCMRKCQQKNDSIKWITPYLSYKGAYPAPTNLTVGNSLM